MGTFSRFHRAMNRRRPLAPRGSTGRQAGYTFTEMVIVCVVLTTLTAVAFPVARYTVRRQAELELRLALRQMRNAIDEYKRYYDAQLLNQYEVEDLGTAGYPPDLETLVEGVGLANAVDDEKKRFLRRIPIDPMTGEQEWGLRSTKDDWDSDSWGGEDLFDVYSLSEGMGLNGIPYAEW